MAPNVDIDDLRNRLEALRRAFDRFFQGLERVPPQKDREALARELHRARIARGLGNAERFRLNQVQQRLNSYGRLWDRNLRAMEAGTFRRPTKGPAKRQAPPEKSADERTFDRFAELCKASGAAAPDRKAFLDSLASKRSSMEAKHGINVRFEAWEKDGRPTLRVLRDKG